MLSSNRVSAKGKDSIRDTSGEVLLDAENMQPNTPTIQTALAGIATPCSVNDSMNSAAMAVVAARVLTGLKGSADSEQQLQVSTPSSQKSRSSPSLNSSSPAQFRQTEGHIDFSSCSQSPSVMSVASAQDTALVASTLPPRPPSSMGIPAAAFGARAAAASAATFVAAGAGYGTPSVRVKTDGDDFCQGESPFSVQVQQGSAKAQAQTGGAGRYSVQVTSVADCSTAFVPVSPVVQGVHISSVNSVVGHCQVQQQLQEMQRQQRQLEQGQQEIRPDSPYTVPLSAPPSPSMNVSQQEAPSTPQQKHLSKVGQDGGRHFFPSDKKASAFSRTAVSTPAAPIAARATTATAGAGAGASGAGAITKLCPTPCSASSTRTLDSRSTPVRLGRQGGVSLQRGPRVRSRSRSCERGSQDAADRPITAAPSAGASAACAHAEAAVDYVGGGAARSVVSSLSSGSVEANAKAGSESAVTKGIAVTGSAPFAASGSASGSGSADIKSRTAPSSETYPISSEPHTQATRVARKMVPFASKKNKKNGSKANTSSNSGSSSSIQSGPTRVLRKSPAKAAAMTSPSQQKQRPHHLHASPPRAALKPVTVVRGSPLVHSSGKKAQKNRVRVGGSAVLPLLGMIGSPAAAVSQYSLPRGVTGAGTGMVADTGADKNIPSRGRAARGINRSHSTIGESPLTAVSLLSTSPARTPDASHTLVQDKESPLAQQAEGAEGEDEEEEAASVKGCFCNASVQCSGSSLLLRAAYQCDSAISSIVSMQNTEEDDSEDEDDGEEGAGLDDPDFLQLNNISMMPVVPSKSFSEDERDVGALDDDNEGGDDGQELEDKDSLTTACEDDDQIDDGIFDALSEDSGHAIGAYANLTRTAPKNSPPQPLRAHTPIFTSLHKQQQFLRRGHVGGGRYRQRAVKNQAYDCTADVSNGTIDDSDSVDEEDRIAGMRDALSQEESAPASCAAPTALWSEAVDEELDDEERLDMCLSDLLLGSLAQTAMATTTYTTANAGSAVVPLPTTYRTSPNALQQGANRGASASKSAAKTPTSGVSSRYSRGLA